MFGYVKALLFSNSTVFNQAISITNKLVYQLIQINLNTLKVMFCQIIKEQKFLMKMDLITNIIKLLLMVDQFLHLTKTKFLKKLNKVKQDLIILLFMENKFKKMLTLLVMFQKIKDKLLTLKSRKIRNKVSPFLRYIIQILIQKI